MLTEAEGIASNSLRDLTKKRISGKTEVGKHQ